MWKRGSFKSVYHFMVRVGKRKVSGRSHGEKRRPASSLSKNKTATTRKKKKERDSQCAGSGRSRASSISPRKGRGSERSFLHNREREGILFRINPGTEETRRGRKRRCIWRGLRRDLLPGKIDRGKGKESRSNRTVTGRGKREHIPPVLFLLGKRCKGEAEGKK